MKLRPFFSIFFLSFCMTTLTYAAHPDTGPGCGLGKLAWGDYPNQQDVGPQIAMATTNTTLGSQTFGISSGTSGCTNDGVILSSEKARVFATLQFQDITQDLAQGGGEHLASLAQILNIPVDDRPEFFINTQKQFLRFIKQGSRPARALIETLWNTLEIQLQSSVVALSN